MFFTQKRKKRNINVNAPTGTERCVLCGCATDYLRSTPIPERRGYVEGCGQLCIACLQRLWDRI